MSIVERKRPSSKRAARLSHSGALSSGSVSAKPRASSWAVRSSQSSTPTRSPTGVKVVVVTPGETERVTKTLVADADPDDPGGDGLAVHLPAPLQAARALRVVDVVARPPVPRARGARAPDRAVPQPAVEDRAHAIARVGGHRV